MEHFLILFIVALICAAGGTGLMACALAILPKKLNRIMVIVCLCLFAVGLAGLISINMSVDRADLTKTETNVYDISKLTTSTVFFEVEDEIKSWSLDDTSYVSVKEATDEYSNVVVKTTTDKDVDWLFDFKTQSTKYVVYLDSELYAKYKNPTVLYEKGE
jgi:hypothetical protein